MISVKNKEPLIYYGSKPIKEVYKGSTKIYPSIDVLSIMDSMILWYDIKKQGATNESMAENPVLVDLSGNGHDITCYNFDWSGMSGIGGYVYNYSTFRRYPERATIEINSTSVRVLSVVNTNAFVESTVSGLPVGTTIQQHKIKVTGLDVINIPNTILKVRLGLNLSDNDVLITEDGVYDIPLHTVDDDFNYSMSINKALEECDILIELLPLYPNALVSDGVDDYCYTEGLPILTDYTAIAKRKWFDEEINSNDWKCFCALNSNDEVNTTFVLETKDASPENFSIQSFGRTTKIELEKEGIVYMTKSSYNGMPILAGNRLGADSLFLFVQKLRNNNIPDRVTRLALYSFLLFDRTLTAEEIEWVKKNMIENEKKQGRNEIPCPRGFLQRFQDKECRG